MRAEADLHPAAAVFGCFNRRVRVEAPRSDIQWLREFCTPAFQVLPDGMHDESVVVKLDSKSHSDLQSLCDRHPARMRDVFTLDGRFEQSPCVDLSPDETIIQSPRHGVLFHIVRPQRTIFLAADPQKSRVRPLLMRTVRELATNAALRGGALPVHAAACLDEERAICPLGAKSAGKTTHLTQALLDGQSFLANDRAMIRRSGDSWTLLGMPTIIKVRQGTLDLFPHIRAAADARPWHWEQTIEEGTRHPRRASRTAEAASFSTAQWLQITRATACHCGTLQSLVFPEFDERWSIPELLCLSPEASAARLQDSILRPGPALQTPSLIDSGTDISESAISAQCRQIAEMCHGFLLKRGASTHSASPVSIYR